LTPGKIYQLVGPQSTCQKGRHPITLGQLLTTTPGNPAEDCIAYKAFGKLKSEQSHRDIWLGQVIATQAKAQGKTKSLWKQHQVAKRYTKWPEQSGLPWPPCSGQGLTVVIGQDSTGYRQEFLTCSACKTACLDKAGH